MGAAALPVTHLDQGWDWSAFQGSASALKWNRRDLASIEAVLELLRGWRLQACIQAGGNLGIFPKALARVFETVYTFEPAPDLFRMLQHNAPEANIVKLQAAVSDTARLIGLSRQRRDGKPDNHEGITHVAGEGVYPSLPIDALRLPACQLLYLDVEGYELFALWGAAETVQRCRPVIAVEVNRGIEFVGYRGDDVRRWILERGYRRAGGRHSDEFYLPAEWEGRA